MSILRDYAAGKRDRVHELRLDARSHETGGAESERCDGDIA